MTSLTQPGESIWGLTPPSHRRHESSAVVGGAERWDDLTAALLRWEVKTRAGFVVPDAHEVVAGERLDVLVPLGPWTIREPIEVTEVVRTDDRVGFAYRTRVGHPVDGEEAFVLSLDGGQVVLTLRSLTRPSTNRRWALVFPLLLVAQAVVRRRYLRVLR